MNTRITLFSMLLCLAGLLQRPIACIASGGGGAAPGEFVFIGQIIDTTPPKGLLRPKDGTVTVHVEEVIRPQTPAAITNSKDTSIAVRLAKTGSPGTGERATFYTQIISFGKVIEVRELKHTAFPMAASAGAEQDEAKNIQQADLARQYAAASVVLAGKVTLVVEPAAAAAASSDGVWKSEHDPEWRDAVVEVSDVIKGHVANKEVTLRFPASTDVAWYRSPKLKEGQQAVFILGKDGTTLSQATAAASESPPVVSNPKSVLPITSLGDVRAAAHKSASHKKIQTQN
jgi:hypothetical protein